MTLICDHLFWTKNSDDKTKGFDYEIELSNAEYSSSENKVQFDAFLTNFSHESQNARALIAVYNNTGDLVGLLIKQNLTLEPLVPCPVTDKIPVSFFGEGYRLKMMLWKSNNYMEPIAADMEMNIQ